MEWCVGLCARARAHGFHSRNKNNAGSIWLTLFKWCLPSGPKRPIRSIASSNPTAVMRSVFRTGINATMNRSRNSIAHAPTVLLLLHSKESYQSNPCLQLITSFKQNMVGMHRNRITCWLKYTICLSLPLLIIVTIR